MSQVVIGTAGHIDHGKTALVKALTGTNTDRLAEEQSRGMTIDLGFAFLTDDITIIDVPGHEKFIRNMVSGVSTIQIALFVIAADDGVMPQTREHLQILSLLKIPFGVIALTKTDMVDAEWAELVEDDIKKLCNGTFLENAPMVKTSTENGNGIDKLKATLIERAEEVKIKQDRGFFRLQVDRSFSKTGFGTVVTGTVISGELKKGEEVQILPSEKTGRVRGLQSHGKTVESVKLGDRAAVNIAGTEKSDLWRGVELAKSGWLKHTNRIIANITIIPDTKWIIKSKQRVRIHVGTQELLARVILLKSRIKAGDTANVIINFESPAVLAMDDRFVIRSYSPLETIGGGIVLDAAPTGSLKEQREWTKQLSVNKDKRYIQFVNSEMGSPKTLDEWCKVFLISKEQLKSIIREHKLKTTKGKPLIYTDENLNKSKSIIINILEDFHKKNPYQKAIKGEELKEKSKFSTNWFVFINNELADNDEIRFKNSEYTLSSYSIELSDKDKMETEKILKIFDAYKLEPVTIDLIAEDKGLSNKKILELLHVLKAQEKVINISDKLWSSAKSINEITNNLKNHFSKSENLSVVEFKDLTNLTRKTAIPLLEYFDNEKITFRDGNNRVKGGDL